LLIGRLQTEKELNEDLERGRGVRAKVDIRKKTGLRVAIKNLSEAYRKILVTTRWNWAVFALHLESATPNQGAQISFDGVVLGDLSGTMTEERL